MKNFIDLLGGVFGITSVSLFSQADLKEWVSLGCMLLVAVCTCFVQCYRLIRDRDNDKKEENKKEENKKEGE